MECIKCNQDKESTHRRRMNTAYYNDDENFTVECDECFEDTQYCRELMWEEYNNSRY